MSKGKHRAERYILVRDLRQIVKGILNRRAHAKYRKRT